MKSYLFTTAEVIDNTIMCSLAKIIKNIMPNIQGLSKFLSLRKVYMTRYKLNNKFTIVFDFIHYFLRN